MMLQVPPIGASSSVSNIVLSTFTSSAIVVWLMQIIKKSKWLKFVEEGKPILNRIVSVGAAIASSLGLSYSWNAQTHTFAIAGISLAGMAVAAWHCLNHFAMQEVIYQAALNKTPAPPLAAQKSLEAQGAQVVAVEPNEVGKLAK